MALHHLKMRYTFFSKSYGSRIEHMLSHKTYFQKIKRIEIVHTTLSDHNSLKLEVNDKGTQRKNFNIWKLSNSLLNSGSDMKSMRKSKYS